MLNIRIVPYDDWAIELIAGVNSGPFSGESRGYCSNSTLHEFVRKMSVYPLASHELPSLQCGYEAYNGREAQLHIEIEIKPYNARGALVVIVRLATPIHRNEHQDLLHKVEARFLATYSDLTDFASVLESCVSAQEGEATLCGTWAVGG